MFKPDAPLGGPRLFTIAQLAAGGAWKLELLHDRDTSVFLWITKGQGVAVLDGVRRGIGVHNAIYIPARRLFSVELGRQGYGQALVLPGSTDIGFPDDVFHLRMRSVVAHAELTALLEAIGREQQGGAAFADDAVAAYARLVAIWFRRHLAENGDFNAASAARRLVRAYAARLVTHHASPATTSDHATELGVTATHLSRVCKAECGRTASAMLTERVLHAARHLLEEAQTPVQDIARHLGFGSAAYFTRFIQQHAGATPTGLRRRAHDRIQPKVHPA